MNLNLIKRLIFRLRLIGCWYPGRAAAPGRCVLSGALLASDSLLVADLKAELWNTWAWSAGGKGVIPGIYPHSVHCI